MSLSTARPAMTAEKETQGFSQSFIDAETKDVLGAAIRGMEAMNSPRFAGLRVMTSLEAGQASNSNRPIATIHRHQPAFLFCSDFFTCRGRDLCSSFTPQTLPYSSFARALFGLLAYHRSLTVLRPSFSGSHAFHLQVP